jgi:polysaccharide chain length determinant protein (PEP-CTERM system associated)
VIPKKKYKPEDYLAIAWQRKWLIVVPWVLVASATAAGARLLPNMYRSETLIQIIPQRLPESYVRSTVVNRVEDRLQSLRQQILNRTNLERLIEEFKLYREERRTGIMEDIVEKMRSDISIEVVKGDAFRVDYVARDPRTAMKVTEKLASLVIEENLRDRETLAEGANQFFETQLEDARQRLVEHEKKLEEYRRQHAGQLPSQLESNLQVIQNAQLQIQTLTESTNRDRDRRLVLERTLADLSAAPAAAPPAVAPADPNGIVGATAAAQLESARAGLATLQVRLKSDHPDIIRMNRVIRELEAKAAAESAAPHPAAAPSAPQDNTRRNQIREVQAEIDNIDHQIAYKRDEEEQLRSTIRTYQQRVDAAPTRESELVALTRDYDTLQKLYANLLGKKEDSNIAANLERRQIGEQFKVLDPARLPERPFSPDLLRINIVGAAAGLVLGLMLAGVVEYLDTSLRTDDDVLLSLSLPVLAMVPIVMTASERRRATFRRYAMAASGIAVLVASILTVIWKVSWR